MTMKRSGLYRLPPGAWFSPADDEYAGKIRIEPDGRRQIVKLAGKSLVGLREEFRRLLFDEYLPYLEKHAVDRTFGGFMCNCHPDGKRVDTDKRAWYEGRGLWLYSYLYNKVSPEESYRTFCDKTVEFILNMQPEGDTFWPGTYTREGKALSEGDIYSDLFIALGLQEYARMEGNERYRDTAKAILAKCLRRFDSPDYEGKPFLPGGPDITAPRMLGHWMVMMRVASCFLETEGDPEVEAILDRCIEAILRYHFNPAYGLMNEVLNHDMSRTDDDYNEWSYTGHTIEVMWFMVDEAVRRGDRDLFDVGAALFRRHVEVSWDDVYTGLFRSVNHVDNHEYMLDVILLFQLEALTGCILLAEQTGSDWAVEWYGKVYGHIRNKYNPKKFGFSPWMRTGDRIPKEEYSYGRIGNYHYPQAILLNMLALDRIIAREGYAAESGE